jgi:hypothetical protein
VERLAAALAALALVGCSPADDRPADAGDGGEPCLFCSDATDDAPVAVQVKGKIDQICANADGCHGAAAGGMPLTPGAEFDAMINVTCMEEPPLLRVRPGDPANSYVFRKLACEGGIEGGCMPLSSGFDPKLAQLFHDWIEAGAPIP